MEKFNKENPDKITIVRTEPDYAKMVAEAAAGNASDLLNLGQGTDVAYYVPRGLFKDMTSYFQKSKVIRMDDIDLLGNREYQFDGKEFGKGAWYGLSKDYNNIGADHLQQGDVQGGRDPDAERDRSHHVRRAVRSWPRSSPRRTARARSPRGAPTCSGCGSSSPRTWPPCRGSASTPTRTKSVMNNDPKMRDIWKYFARFFAEDIAPEHEEPGPELGGRQLPVRPRRHRAAGLLVRRAAAHRTPASRRSTAGRPPRCW